MVVISHEGYPTDIYVCYVPSFIFVLPCLKVGAVPLAGGSSYLTHRFRLCRITAASMANNIEQRRSTFSRPAIFGLLNVVLEAPGRLGLTGGRRDVSTYIPSYREQACIIWCHGHPASGIILQHFTRGKQHLHSHGRDLCTVEAQ